ncbi:MAG: SIMPL domain-containing protein, partial [archaeon]
GYYYISAQQPTVSASEVYQIKATPDKASVSVTIEVKNASAEIAQSTAQEINKAFVSDLRAKGVDENSVKTISVNVAPNWVYDMRGSRQEGYVSTISLSVEISDFKQVGKVVDSAVQAGAYVYGINFELSQAKQNEYKTQALSAAGKDAMAKAEATASGLGKKLGGLVSVENQEFNYYPYPMYARAGTSMAEDNSAAQKVAMNVNPSDIDVSASINVVYRTALF